MKSMLQSCRIAVISVLGLTTSLLSSVVAGEATVTPFDLRCEYASEPCGIDTAQPRLSWKLKERDPDLRGLRQTAFQVLVATTKDGLEKDQGDLWDSGKVSSDETLHRPYSGRLLHSSQRVFWKVRVWDQAGAASAWSPAASWTMGILSEGDWKASWIGAPKDGAGYETMLLRREFSTKPKLNRAVVHVCGLGHFELSLNGARVGEDLLTPGWTKYDKTCLYESYDVTAQLREGKNAIGLLLGNGMYNVHGGRYLKFKGSFGPLKAICQLHLEYADGKVEILGTDAQWRVHPGPITFSCVFGGEDYDARLEPPAWDLPDFDDSHWAPAQPVQGPGGKLKGFASSAPPIRGCDRLKVARVVQLRGGVAVYDFGQNVSLMPGIQVKGKAGSAFKITPAELLRPDGSVDRGSCGGGEAYWKYTLAGRGSERWMPKFFYHGCRYVQVESLPSPDGELPVLESIDGVVVHSSSAPVGEFDCSNELFNDIRTLIRWAQRSNMMHVLTDCPHRERLGWLEEYHLNGPSFRYEFDLARLYTKCMTDMADSQLASGLVPDIAPEYVVFDGGFRDSPEWGSAFILSAWQQYEWTGDVELLRKHYPGMKRYVAYLASRSKDEIVSHGLGDWYDIGPNPPGYAQLTPIPFTATAFYYLDTQTLARIAKILGKADDARDYEARAAKIRAAFNKTFFNSSTGQYAAGSQCANSIALVMGLAEPAHRTRLLQAVVDDVRRRGNALTAGDVGYRYLLRALAEGNRSDVIFAMNNQSEKPGYGYQLKQGATSLTEAWDAGRASSQNHFMLGHIIEWFYHDLAGLGVDPAGPGFKRILIKPQPVDGVDWARASYDSVRGRVACGWRRAGGIFTLELQIPPNTSATVFLPGKGDVQEAGRPLDKASGVKLVRREENFTVLEAFSGTYGLTIPMARFPQ